MRFEISLFTIRQKFLHIWAIFTQKKLDWPHDNLSYKPEIVKLDLVQPTYTLFMLQNQILPIIKS